MSSVPTIATVNFLATFAFGMAAYFFSMPTLINCSLKHNPFGILHEDCMHPLLGCG